MLTIRTTGLEDYLDGSSNIKMLVLGDPGVGKTRSSSFWPKPIYADIEAGRASIRDRKMPYAEIHNSTEMLQFIVFLENEARKCPNRADRPYQTVVVDTIDGYSRKVQQEWLQLSGKPTFSGYEAWGYLDQKMQQLLVRLLNLDYNVIVNVHFKEKDGEDGAAARIVLQLKGDIATSVYNDFDLVGYMGSYWDKQDGERVEKRGLTFHKTPDRPSLKDRFGVMPRWIPITFTETDYTQLRDALATGLDGVEASEVVGEIPALVDAATIPTTGVVSPQAAGAGALPAQEAREMPLDKLDKPTLVQMARELGISVKGNALKSEVVKAIEEHKAAAAQSNEAATTEPVPAAEPTEPVETTDATVASETKATERELGTNVAEATPEPVVETPTDTVTTDNGTVVDTATGEIVDELAADKPVSVDDVAAAFGATVEETAPEPEPTPEPIAAPAEAPAPGPVCGTCGKDLRAENQDYVRLSAIKYRQRLCNDGYVKAKAGQLSAPLPADFICR